MPDSNRSGLSDNSLGAIAYITFVPALFFLAVAPYNKKFYVRFHAWQSLVFNVFALFIWWVLGCCAAFVVFHGLTALMILEWVRIVFMVAVTLLWLWCVISALNGKLFKLSCIGAWCERQANK
jgi:uncharacterized membrane protein